MTRLIFNSRHKSRSTRSSGKHAAAPSGVVLNLPTSFYFFPNLQIMYLPGSLNNEPQIIAIVVRNGNLQNSTDETRTRPRTVQHKLIINARSSFFKQCHGLREHIIREYRNISQTLLFIAVLKCLRRLCTQPSPNFHNICSVSFFHISYGYVSN